MNKYFGLAVLISAAFNVNATTMTDFENPIVAPGSVSGWHIGGPARGREVGIQVAAETEENGNQYLKYTTDGSGHDSRITLMAGKEYRGNYNAMGVDSLVARMRNLSDKTLTMHVAFGNTLADLRARYATEGVELVNDGEWHTLTFDLRDNLHFVPIGGHGSSRAQFTADEVLANIKDLRFTQGVFGEVYYDRRGPFNGYNAGEEGVFEVHFDDIQLVSGMAAGNVSSVPVPAAVWLFTSALGGLVVSRKRTV